MLWDLHPTPTPSQDPNSSLTQLHNDEIVLREDDFLQPSRCLFLASGFLGSNFNKLFFSTKFLFRFVSRRRQRRKNTFFFRTSFRKISFQIYSLALEGTKIFSEGECEHHRGDRRDLSIHIERKSTT